MTQRVPIKIFTTKQTQNRHRHMLSITWGSKNDENTRPGHVWSNRNKFTWKNPFAHVGWYWTWEYRRSALLACGRGRFSLLQSLPLLPICFSCRLGYRCVTEYHTLTNNYDKHNTYSGHDWSSAKRTDGRAVGRTKGWADGRTDDGTGGGTDGGNTNERAHKGTGVMASGGAHGRTPVDDRKC